MRWPWPDSRKVWSAGLPRGAYGVATLTLVALWKALRPDVATRTLCTPYQSSWPEIANFPFLLLLVLPKLIHFFAALTWSLTLTLRPGTLPCAATTAPVPAVRLVTSHFT